MSEQFTEVMPDMSTISDSVVHNPVVEEGGTLILKNCAVVNKRRNGIGYGAGQLYIYNSFFSTSEEPTRLEKALAYVVILGFIGAGVVKAFRSRWDVITSGTDVNGGEFTTGEQK